MGAWEQRTRALGGESEANAGKTGHRDQLQPARNHRLRLLGMLAMRLRKNEVIARTFTENLYLLLAYNLP